MSGHITQTLYERFIVKANITETCWLWTAFVDKAGYARLRASGNGEVLYAHRYAYEIHVGPIPDGLTIDHLCRVRHCVNPAHLEAVTYRENTLRGESPAAKAARRSHCLNGHLYDIVRNGARRCSTCDRAADRRRYARAREQVAA